MAAVVDNRLLLSRCCDVYCAVSHFPTRWLLFPHCCCRYHYSARCSSRLQLQDGAGDCEDQNISPEMSQNKDISSSPASRDHLLAGGNKKCVCLIVSNFSHFLNNFFVWPFPWVTSHTITNLWPHTNDPILVGMDTGDHCVWMWDVTLIDIWYSMIWSPILLDKCKQ